MVRGPSLLLPHPAQAPFHVQERLQQGGRRQRRFDFGHGVEVRPLTRRAADGAVS